MDTNSINIENFKEIYNAYFDPLCKYLNFYTKDQQTIEDIVQEVFLRLWENKEVIKVSHFKGYLFRSARNKILNYHRDEINRYKILEEWFESQLIENQEEEERFQIEELIQTLLDAIAALPPQCRDIFLLSKSDNLTYKQIAEQKQISVKTVENQVGIALKKIRDYMFVNVKFHYPVLLILLDLLNNKP
ncbi:RNA polymerase sigma factor [Parabacteroides sp. Marseille-P3160]|uniref:RNA polymerase sigma factor n=1 Tax=Parabacteroides sp. Marseille-P3160 TaxID=1917887 RepID=UPI001F34D2D7|nr:RNA polymerase sigma-70 factor [Parabacteroides sp. Marseille-P3160]